MSDIDYYMSGWDAYLLIGRYTDYGYTDSMGIDRLRDRYRDKRITD